MSHKDLRGKDESLWWGGRRGRFSETSCREWRLWDRYRKGRVAADRLYQWHLLAGSLRVKQDGGRLSLVYCLGRVGLMPWP